MNAIERYNETRRREIQAAEEIEHRDNASRSRFNQPWRDPQWIIAIPKGEETSYFVAPSSAKSTHLTNVREDAARFPFREVSEATNAMQEAISASRDWNMMRPYWAHLGAVQG